MNFVSSLCSKSATYHTPDATIIFTKSWFGWGALSVRIETARLSIRSVSKADLNNCANLFSNREVVKLYGTGQTKTYEETASRLNLWVKRWKSQDPYSGMAVFERSSGAFVGLAILGHSAAPGISELAGLGFPSFWNQGYGIETTKALLSYATATRQEGFLLKHKPLTCIRATARPDNLASCKILEQLGFTKIKTDIKWGNERIYYERLTEAPKSIPSP